jgi:hypothetical protein
LVLAARIVKVEQGGLRGSIRIVDYDPPRNFYKKARQHRLCQCFSREKYRRCALPPEMSEMRFAAAGRAM